MSVSRPTVPRTFQNEVEATYREVGPRLWRALFASTGDREIANDAVSEAFAQLLARGDSVANMSAWLWRASFSIARGFLKARTQNVELHLSDARAVTDDVSVPEIVRALRMIPTNQRMAIVLHDYADKPVHEVASILGMSAATVYVHLSRARRRLREIMKESQ
jgi:RNA polymerase sigma factor (sigma-70 family)